MPPSCHTTISQHRKMELQRCIASIKYAPLVRHRHYYCDVNTESQFLLIVVFLVEIFHLVLRVGNNLKKKTKLFFCYLSAGWLSCHAQNAGPTQAYNTHSVSLVKPMQAQLDEILQPQLRNSETGKNHRSMTM